MRDELKEKEILKRIEGMLPASIKVSDYLVTDQFYDKVMDYKPDAILSYKDKPFTAVEINPDDKQNDFFVSMASCNVRSYCIANKYSYGLILIGDQAYLLSESDEFMHHDPIRVEEAVEEISNRITTISTFDVQQLADPFLEKLKQIANNIDFQNDDTKNILDELTVDDLHWDEIETTPTIITLSPKFEKKLFTAILGKYKDSKICRYTTRQSFFRIITTEKQSLCSIVGMNDRSECYYVDEYLAKRGGVPFKKTNRVLPSSNNYFILSCSRKDNDLYVPDMEDNLTMWRMYADECKGVSMVFEVKQELMNESYVLAPISYGKVEPEVEPYDFDENGNALYELTGKRIMHPELDFLYDILSCEIGGYEYRFSTFNSWKHFFKSYEYRSENEVRLMCVTDENDNKKWIEANNVYCPVIEKSIKNSDNTFPLILSKVILGPKFIEQAANVIQIKKMIQESNIIQNEDITCEPSKIDNYR